MRDVERMRRELEQVVRRAREHAAQRNQHFKSEHIANSRRRHALRSAAAAVAAETEEGPDKAEKAKSGDAACGSPDGAGGSGSGGGAVGALPAAPSRVSAEKRAAAGTAWRQAATLMLETKRSLRSRLSSAVAAAASQAAQAQDATSLKEKLLREEKRLRETLNASRAELRKAETARRQTEARLAKELAFRDRLHAYVSDEENTVAATAGTVGNARRLYDEKRWVDILVSLRSKAEAEAERLHWELQAVLGKAQRDKEARVAYCGAMAFSNNSIAAPSNEPTPRGEGEGGAEGGAGSGIGLLGVEDDEASRRQRDVSRRRGRRETLEAEIRQAFKEELGLGDDDDEQEEEGMLMEGGDGEEVAAPWATARGGGVDEEVQEAIRQAMQGDEEEEDCEAAAVDLEVDLGVEKEEEEEEAQMNMKQTGAAQTSANWNWS
jgi:hypothetical protein